MSFRDNITPVFWMLFYPIIIVAIFTKIWWLLLVDVLLYAIALGSEIVYEKRNKKICLEQNKSKGNNQIQIEYLPEGYVYIPDWDDECFEYIDMKEIMDLDWFEENVLKRTIQEVGWLKRNSNGDARLNTRLLEVWICNDCFSVFSDYDDNGNEIPILLDDLKIVVQAKYDPRCFYATWYLENDGKIGIDKYDKKKLIDYKKQKQKIIYFIHTIDY